MKDNAEHNERGNEDIESVLRLGGSRWMVGKRNDAAGLEARVPIGVQEAAEAVMATAGRAGQLLSEAWHSAFGANPDPEDAYEKAIKAGTVATITESPHLTKRKRRCSWPCRWSSGSAQA